MKLPNFDAAFRHGQVFRSVVGRQSVQVHVRTLGNVDLPSGFIEIVDPLLYSEDSNDANELPSGPPDVTPGSYPAELSTGDAPIAMRIIFENAPAIRYEHFHDVSVDSATIAALDVTGLDALATFGDEHLLEAVEKVVEQNGGVLRIGDVRAAVVGTGADGGYPCFWAIGERGHKVSLIVDMGGLYEEIETGIRISRKELIQGTKVLNDELSLRNISLHVVELSATQMVLAALGYDSARTFQFRTSDNRPIHQSKLFHRDRKLLTLSFPHGLPEDAHLFVEFASEPCPMEPVDG